jgi:PAT family beta-lactamase induction signal transducer AmpG
MPIIRNTLAPDTKEAASHACLIREQMPSPWAYVITLYLPFGVMNGMLSHFPVTLFKLFGFSNTVIGFLSGIGLVAALRFVYTPWLDALTTKRRLSLFTLIAASAILSVLAALIFARLEMNLFAWTMVAALFGLALVAATHETAADGYYIRALDAKLQAQFIGIKTAAIRIGSLAAVMGLLYGATRIAASFGAVDADSPDKGGFHTGFAAAYLASAALMLGALLWNKFHVPVISQDTPVSHQRFAFLEVLREYFAQPRVVCIMLLIVLYRFGEGFLYMKVPFYLDPIAEGGLASRASAIPLYTILTEIPWTILGGILGGYIIKWFGLRRTFLPLGLCMNLPNLFYVWLAATQPTLQVHWFGENLNVALLGAASIEAFGYGMSFSALFYYMHIMATESGRNKTSILAISFALMNVGFFLPGMLSGIAHQMVGYTGVFLISSTVGLAALGLIPFVPMPKAETGATPG